MKALIFVAIAAVAFPGASAIYAQSPPSTAQYITRDEFEKYKQEQDKKHQEELRKARQEAAAAPAPAAADNTDLEKEVKDLKDKVNSVIPGSSTFIIAGDGEVGFSVPKHGNSTFDATLSPLILWQPYDNILIEGGWDMSISTDASGASSTSIDLGIADISYILCDNAAVGAGLFVVPFGQFHNHFDPPWINKLPDSPLPFGDGGIAPGSELGAFLRGAIPISSTKVVYDVYVANGPQLITNDPAAAGSLNFDDFTDTNHSKAVGGRIGYLPMNNLEVGYSAQWSRPSPDGFQKVDALLQAVDLNYYLDADWASGRFVIRTEWVWSHVGSATYGSGGAGGFGPINFKNDRDGGYIELDYRPSKVDNSFVRKLEFVSRYDMLNVPVPASVGGDRETRWTFGIDYWITPSVVLKTAVELDDRKIGQSNNAFLVQLGFGL